MSPAELLSSSSFKDFQQYIDTKSLPQDFSQESFIKLLQQLHDKTGHLWQKGGCYKATEITLYLNTLLERSNPGIAAKTFIYETTHSWPEIIIPSGNNIVVDVFGVLEKGEIIPHLGTIGSVSQSQFPVAWEIYRHGRPLNELEEALFFLKS